MDVISVKVFSGLVFFLLVMFFGWIPFWMLRRWPPTSDNKQSSLKKLPFARFLHSMASGVLISTCLLNLLPEAIEAVHEALGSSHTMKGRELGLRSIRVNVSSPKNLTLELRDLNQTGSSLEVKQVNQTNSTDDIPKVNPDVTMFRTTEQTKIAEYSDSINVNFNGSTTYDSSLKPINNTHPTEPPHHTNQQLSHINRSLEHIDIVNEHINLSNEFINHTDENSNLNNELSTIELHSTPSVDTSDANDDSMNSNKDLNKGNYPLAELLIALGFLSVYILDSSFKAVQRSRERKRKSEYFSFSDVMLPNKRKQSDDNHNKPKIISEYTDENTDSSVDEYFLDKRPAYSKPSKRGWPLTESSGDIGGLLDNPSDSDNESVDTDDSEETARIEVNSKSEEQHPLAESHKSDKAKSVHTDVRSIALVGALCVHGFFDGVLLGLQTSVHVLVTLMLALSIHKCFVSLSMSLTLYNHHGKDFKTSRVLLYTFLFALSAPVGTFLSAGVVHGAISTFSPEQEGGSSSLVPGCLQAFAVGTFMFVAFTETLDNHKSSDRIVVHQLISHVFLIVGFGAMAALRAALGEV